jgi:hypothetical protein
MPGTFKELAALARSGNRIAAGELKDRAQDLWHDLAFRSLKAGVHGGTALREATAVVGRDFRQRLENAASGKLDEIAAELRAQALAQARRLLAFAADGREP